MLGWRCQYAMFCRFTSPLLGKLSFVLVDVSGQWKRFWEIQKQSCAVTQWRAEGVHMWIILLFPALILVPFFAYRFARRRVPRHVFGITGAAFGAIVSPFSTGLYSWFFLSPFLVLPGIMGLVLAFIHGPPGFYLGIYLGLVRGIEVASHPAQKVIIEVINAVVWGICYGLVGYMVDYVRNRNKTAGAK